MLVDGPGKIQVKVKLVKGEDITAPVAAKAMKEVF
jgi:hypothetical protein